MEVGCVRARGRFQMSSFLPVTDRCPTVTAGSAGDPELMCKLDTSTGSSCHSPLELLLLRLDLKFLGMKHNAAPTVYTVYGSEMEKEWATFPL